jgi:hypothetical protein
MRGGDCRGELGAGGEVERNRATLRASSQPALRLAAPVSLNRGYRGRLCSVRFCSGRSGKPTGASPIEIEIGGATLRVGAGVELGFLGKVLCLLKAMR